MRELSLSFNFIITFKPHRRSYLPSIALVSCRSSWVELVCVQIKAVAWGQIKVHGRIQKLWRFSSSYFNLMLSTLFVLPSLVSDTNNDLSIAVKRVQNGEARCRTITTIDEKTISEEGYPKVHRIKCTLALDNSGFSPSLKSFRMPCHFVFIYISPCRFFILMITMFLTTFK